MAVAAIMVSSMAAYTVFYNFPDQDAPSGGDGTGQNPTAIDFEASGVNATVSNLLPSIKIQAETKETDLSKVNNSVYSIEGIKTVSGTFQQYPYGFLGTGYIYVADISFAADLNSSYVIELLEEKSPLEYIYGYNYALVELPKKITMQSADSSLGLTRDFNFLENMSTALVGLDAMEGDFLLVSVSATFIGSEPANLMAIEEKNLTAEPVQKTALLEAPIDSLEPTLLFDSEIAYGLFDSASSLKEDLNAIEGVSGASVYFSGIEPVLSIGGQADESGFVQLQAFLDDLNALAVSIANNPLDGTVSFEEGIASKVFSEKKSAIEAKIRELDLNAFVSEEKGFLSGEISLASIDSKQPASLAGNLLKSKGIDAVLKQPGAVAVETIYGPEPYSSFAYSVPSGTIETKLFPGHKVGGNVSVSIDFTLVRSQISAISAEEKN